MKYALLTLCVHGIAGGFFATLGWIVSMGGNRPFGWALVVLDAYAGGVPAFCLVTARADRSPAGYAVVASRLSELVIVALCIFFLGALLIPAH